MKPEDMVAHFAARRGWNLDSQLTIVLRYIENQQDNDAFWDFLEQEAVMEEADAAAGTKIH